MTECVLYQGRLERKGYGRVGEQLAHRVIYKNVHGSIPEGMDIDHICFNPSCVSPEHLRPLTPHENRSLQRSSFKPFCVNGHAYTKENTYLRPDGQGGRRGRDCRACIRERVKNYSERIKVA